MLFASFGRLGDSILGAAFVAQLRQWFGGPVFAVGRAEAAVVLAPLVDRFVPLSPAALAGERAALASLLADLDYDFRLILTDPHVFQGGEVVAALVDALPAAAKFAYAGHASPDAAATSRAYPGTATLVPSLPKPAGATDAELVHVWHDLRHYYAAVLQHCGHADFVLPEQPLLPAAALDADALARFGLTRHAFVACQPSSSQPKKDWPATAFSDLFVAHRDQHFVLLGSAADAARVPAPEGALDLRGRTSLAQALQLAASCRAFVGIDSGLAHAAAVAGRPTVCALPAATLGRFFPYPASLQRPLVQVVWHRGYAACAGCLGICDHAPIWRTHRQGLPCMRELGPGQVAAALTEALLADATIGRSAEARRG